jgi:hypothetical protein
MKEMASMADELQRYRQRHHQVQVNTNPTNHENNSANPPVTTPDDMSVDPYEPYSEVLEGGFIEEYQGAARSYGRGATFMDMFDGDMYNSERVNNLYYPFASKDEWELASFLLRSNLSMALITELLSLSLVGFQVLWLDAGY